MITENTSVVLRNEVITASGVITAADSFSSFPLQQEAQTPIVKR